MARKKLNKKVAIIGAAIVAVLMLCMMAVLLKLMGSAEKFISDAQAAYSQAMEQTDPGSRQELLKQADRNFRKAYGKSKGDEAKVEVLFMMDDVFLAQKDWRSALNAYYQIIQIMPDNAHARFPRLHYMYIMAESLAERGGRGPWKDIKEQANEFLEKVARSVLEQDVSEFNISELSYRLPASSLEAYLYYVRGRATLEGAKSGVSQDQRESVAQAIADFEKVLSIETDNIEAILQNADAKLLTGNIYASLGQHDQRDLMKLEAKKILEKADRISKNDPKAKIRLLSMIPALEGYSTREDLIKLESDYQELVKKYSGNAFAFSALADYYSILGKDYLDRAISAMEKAHELKPQDASYGLGLARLYYQTYSILGRDNAFGKSIEVLEQTLNTPSLSDETGPEAMVLTSNRLSLYSFIARFSVERVLRGRYETETEKQEMLTRASSAVHQIEQIRGSGEDLTVAKWRGLLDLANGQTTAATRKLYSIYEQLNAAGERDSYLAYVLAKQYENSVELGAAVGFYTNALSIQNRSEYDTIDRMWPETLLDFAELILKLKGYNSAQNVVKYFEVEHSAIPRSRQLLAFSYIGAGEHEKAQELISELPVDANTLGLKLELTGARMQQIMSAAVQKQMSDTLEGENALNATDQYLIEDIADLRVEYLSLIEQMLAIAPERINDMHLSSVSKLYLAEGKPEKAQEFLSKVLSFNPDNIEALFNKKILASPDPLNISGEKEMSIRLGVLTTISDPLVREGRLASYYDLIGKKAEALIHFKEAIKIVSNEENWTDFQKFLFKAAFNLALTEDVDYAKKLAQTAKKINIDDCEGKFFEASLAMQNKKYSEALTFLNECIKVRPVFSTAYLLRSRVYFALDQFENGLADIKKGVSLNPLDSQMAVEHAIALYNHIEKLGTNASVEQNAQVRSALDNAIATSSGEQKLGLLSLYAQFISSTEPDRALALRQSLQKIKPSVENAYYLGKMAMEFAITETNADKKKFLLETALASYNAALKLNPTAAPVLMALGDYYRQTGEPQKAEEILSQSNKSLLWNHYLTMNDLVSARKVLDAQYKENPKELDTLKGLLMVCEKDQDEEGVRKYSEELVKADESSANRLYQVQSFINLGLVKEASKKLDALKEKYPSEKLSVLLEGLLQMRMGQLQGALESFNKFLETDRSNARAWMLRGSVNSLLGDIVKAVDDLRFAKTLSDDPEISIELAKVYQKSGKPDDAIIELQSCLRSSKAPVSAGLLLEQLYINNRRLEQLQKFYTEVLEKYPDSPMWLGKLGNFYLQTKQYEQAEKSFSKSWEASKSAANSLSHTALFGYVNSLMLQKKTDKGIEICRNLLDGPYGAVAYLGLAMAKNQFGDIEAAVQYCENAVEKVGDQQDMSSWITQQVYGLLGVEKVNDLYARRLLKNPESFTANFAMYSLSRLQGKYNDAIGYLEKCISIIGAETEQATQYNLQKVLLIQMLYEKTSDKQYVTKAIAEYESLLKKMPNSTAVLNNLAYLLADDSKRIGEALNYAEQVYEKVPNDPGFLDTYAYVLYKSGDYSKADQFLFASMQQYEQKQLTIPADVYEHLGMIKEKLGDSMKAADAYKRALELVSEESQGSRHNRLREALERLK